MECFLPEHLAAAEDGYCLVLFRTAVGALHSIMPPPSIHNPPPIAEICEIVPSMIPLQATAFDYDDTDDDEGDVPNNNFTFSASGVDAVAASNDGGVVGGRSTAIDSIESIVNRVSDLGLHGD